MKHIALLSACNHNYGSLLQSYAFQSYLKSINIDTDILIYTQRPILRQLSRLFYIPLVKMKIKITYRNWSCRIFRPSLWRNIQEREKMFHIFCKKYLRTVQPIASKKQLSECTEQYDSFIVGSDQLWNPINLGTDFFTLNFVPNNKLKLSYATSFGISQIPHRFIKKYKKYLMRFDLISTREKSGQDIIHRVTGRNVPVVCDPTILIGNDFWNNLKGTNPIVDGKYIFCYFISPRSDIRDIVKKIAVTINLPIVSLPHIDEFVKADTTFGDKQIFEAGPIEFINLISNAAYVFTDSFHATVFSIMQKRSFFVFDRFHENKKHSMNSRITSLLSILGISERRIGTSIDINQILQMNIDYDSVTKKLSEFTTESRNYVQRMKEYIEHYS